MRKRATHEGRTFAHGTHVPRESHVARRPHAVHKPHASPAHAFGLFRKKLEPRREIGGQLAEADKLLFMRGHVAHLHLTAF